LFQLKLKVFSFVDKVSEVKKGQSITAFFTLKGTEEFLVDHFEGFPVMPGVLLLESLKQAAVRLLNAPGKRETRYKLDAVPLVKFGQFVRPGNRFRIQVEWVREIEGRVEFEGRVDLMNGEAVGPKALQAAFSLSAQRNDVVEDLEKDR
jgi:3-hydroxyacyl-[acyl-carrier-protein] dehydratase